MTNATKKIINVIQNNFPNGVRDDYITVNKILNLYLDNLSNEMVARDEILTTIQSYGIRDSGRFYFVAIEEADRLRTFFTALFQKFPIVYYSAVHKKHADFFTQMHIFSPNVLKKILQAISCSCFYFRDFCSQDKFPRLDSAVKKIFSSTKEALSLAELTDKLGYVPPKKISEVLADTSKFMPTIDGRHILRDTINFDMEEIFKARHQIISCLDKHAYAAPEDYNLASNLALNPEVAEKDMRTLIYENFFADDFMKRGRKIFRRSAPIVAAKKISFRDRLQKFFTSREENTRDYSFPYAYEAASSAEGFESLSYV